MAAKIPRATPGAKPSAVPGGPLPSPAAAAAPFAALGDLADVGYKIAANEEQQAAENQRAAREAMQAITNEVEAGRRAGDFEESLVDAAEGIKDQFFDEPERAPEQLLNTARMLADEQLKVAPNTQVGLELAQRSNSRIDSAVRQMHDWAISRQTQKAKGDLSIIINRATGAAEALPTVEALGAFVNAKEAELGNMFANVLGNEAPARMAQMREDMVRGWVTVTASKGREQALYVAKSLDATTGPLVDNMGATERKTARNEAIAAYEGSAKREELEIIKTGINRNTELGQQFLRGNPEEFARLAYTQKRALNEQLKAFNAGLVVDKQTLKSMGVDADKVVRKDIPELIKSRIAFVDALETAQRRQTPYDAPEDVSTVNALMVQMDKALRKSDGKDMRAILEQQENVAVALTAKKISLQTATTMFKTMALAVEKAAAEQEDISGFNGTDRTVWLTAREPREMGIAELNRQFDTNEVNQPAQVKMLIRMSYEALLNTEMGKGAVSAERARKLALRAIAIETGKPVKGAE